MKKRLFSTLVCLLILASLVIPGYAADSVDFASEGNVIDLVGVITQSQDAALEAATENAANTYSCGCYILVTDDYTQFGGTPPEAVINLYHDNRLGVGSGRDGILLLLDVAHRKFAFFVYGDHAEYVFNAYGQEQLEKVFLDDFGNDQWYDGLEDFVVECGDYMEAAAQGTPVSQSKTGYYAVAIVVGVVISAIVCLVLAAQMKSVHQGTEAAAYIVPGGLNISERTDHFLYKTTVTHDSGDDDNDFSSSSFSGGGGSGRSGSF